MLSFIYGRVFVIVFGGFNLIGSHSVVLEHLHAKFVIVTSSEFKTGPILFSL